MDKKIKISCISDTHGNRIKPSRGADIVVLAGDLSPHNWDNFRFFAVARYGYAEAEVDPKTNPNWNYRKIDVKAEGEYQLKYHKNETLKSLKSRGVSLDDVVVVAGNHDFFDPADLFPHGLKQGTKIVTIKGVKIGIVSGILPYRHEWHDEISHAVFQERIKELDRDIDILVSHAPPFNVLDYGDDDHIGSLALYTAIFGIHSDDPPYFTNLKAHIFGHAHPSKGKIVHEVDGREIVFVNASNSRYDIELSL